MIHYIMALMFVSGAMLAGQSGEWFPWANILGILLWLVMMIWIRLRDNQSNKGGQVGLTREIKTTYHAQMCNWPWIDLTDKGGQVDSTKEVFDPTKVIDSYILMKILNSSNLMIFADDSHEDGLDDWKDHFVERRTPWALCREVTKSGHTVYQLWRIRKAGEE